MAGLNKAFLALAIISVALVLAKAHRMIYEDYKSSRDSTDSLRYKRAADCGSGREPEGAFSRKCRSSCKRGERHISMFDNKCSSGQKCCMCHARGGSCAVDFGK